MTKAMTGPTLELPPSAPTRGPTAPPRVAPLQYVHVRFSSENSRVKSGALMSTDEGGTRLPMPKPWPGNPKRGRDGPELHGAGRQSGGASTARDTSIPQVYEPPQAGCLGDADLRRRRYGCRTVFLPLLFSSLPRLWTERAYRPALRHSDEPEHEPLNREAASCRPPARPATKERWYRTPAQQPHPAPERSTGPHEGLPGTRPRRRIQPSSLQGQAHGDARGPRDGSKLPPAGSPLQPRMGPVGPNVPSTRRQAGGILGNPGHTGACPHSESRV